MKEFKFEKKLKILNQYYRNGGKKTFFYIYIYSINIIEKTMTMIRVTEFHRSTQNSMQTTNSGGSSSSSSQAEKKWWW